jgi:hypothetical protein
MIQGFVHIVESPSSSDLLADQVEGRALCGALQLARIPYVYNLASSLQTFREALADRLVQALKSPALSGRRPILHLSMHGNDQGVGLTSGEFISWEELHTELAPLLNAMNGGLLVCMSSCFGFSGCRMVMNTTTDHPFWAIVGNSRSVDWSDAAIAYITFYHQFFKETPLDKCVDLMRSSSGDSNFLQFSGHGLKQSWINTMARTNAGSIETALNGQSSTRSGGGLLDTAP